MSIRLCCMQTFPSFAMTQMRRSVRLAPPAVPFLFVVIWIVQVDAPWAMPILPGIVSSGWVKSMDVPVLKGVSQVNKQCE